VLTVGQLTNNLQTDSSDNVYDSMLVSYLADSAPPADVPEGRPWLLGLCGLVTLGFAVRRRRSFG
jgi:MYXO-CTERM domain-containing protein